MASSVAAIVPRGPVHILDPKRSRNISLVLKSARTEFPAVWEAIRLLRLNDLGEDTLRTLLQASMRPESPDVTVIQQWLQSALFADIPRETLVAALAPAERWLWGVHTATAQSLLPPRAAALLYRLDLSGWKSAVIEHLSGLHQTCEELERSPTWRALLNIIRFIALSWQNTGAGALASADPVLLPFDALKGMGRAVSYDGKTTLLSLVAEAGVHLAASTNNFSHLVPQQGSLPLSLMQQLCALLALCFPCLQGTGSRRDLIAANCGPLSEGLRNELPSMGPFLKRCNASAASAASVLDSAETDIRLARMGLAQVRKLSEVARERAWPAEEAAAVESLAAEAQDALAAMEDTLQKAKDGFTRLREVYAIDEMGNAAYARPEAVVRDISDFLSQFAVAERDLCLKYQRACRTAKRENVL
jgi:hypothetical protein